MNVAAVQNKRSRSRIHPKKFGLYLACASMMMMFLAFTSAYIVRQAAGNWYEFPIPNMFFYSTAVILASSVALQGSYNFFRKGNAILYKGLLVIAFLLGILFLVLQYQGWMQMMDMGVELTTNPSSSFIYVISGTHAAHLMAGLGVLIVAMVQAFSLPMKVTPMRKLRFEMSLVFWHFVDFLWIYLLIFFLIYKT